MRQITFWIAAHVFRITKPLIYLRTGSGDRTFDWVFTFWLVTVAVLATAIWSVLDRRRENYITLHKWFWLFIRFCLAAQMFSYGMAKLVPLQMPFPYLTGLLEPFGNFSPMGVLWASIGASPAYEMFTGGVEMLGGILLVFPRTTLFGALVCLANMFQVFMLNMTYDVPVKLTSFHLMLLSLFLLAPELRQLANFFFLNRPVKPYAPPQLFCAQRSNRIAFAAQVIFAMLLVGLNAHGSWSRWHTYGGGRPKSPLYGIWNVDQLSIDGQVRSPLITDYARWRRVIFDFPTWMAFQRMDESFAGYGSTINDKDKMLTLTKSGDKNWKATFTFQRGAQDQMTLDGNMDNHKLHMQLQLVDRSKFLLVSRGFHWIQDYPYNR